MGVLPMTLALRHAVKFFSFLPRQRRPRKVPFDGYWDEEVCCLCGDLSDCAADDSSGDRTACEPWLRCGRPVPNHLSKRRSTPRVKQRQRRKRQSSLWRRLPALCAVHDIDSAARAIHRHRHRSACELRAFSSPVHRRTVRRSCFWSQICQRSSAIRHDQLTFKS